MNKICARCGIEKPVSEFNKEKKSKDGFNSSCRQCTRDYNRAWSKKNYKQTYERRKENIKENNKRWRKNNNWVSRKVELKMKYGISVEQYNEMLEKQNGVCAICGGVSPNNENLCVDHDHKTGTVRGLLCRKCNIAVGHFSDDTNIIQKALNYLLGGNK